LLYDKEGKLNGVGDVKSSDKSNDLETLFQLQVYMAIFELDSAFLLGHDGEILNKEPIRFNPVMICDVAKGFFGAYLASISCGTPKKIPEKQVMDLLKLFLPHLCGSLLN
jgi:hypothetical protein